MDISLNLGAWNAVFAVPACLVDQHLKLAGAVQIKALLSIVRHAGEPLSLDDLAAALGLPVADVKDALQYWIETGLLRGQEAGLAPSLSCTPEPVPEPQSPSPEEPAEPPAETESPSSPPAEAPPPPARRPRPSSTFVAQRMTQSHEISFLMQEAQQILGRTISPALSSILLSIHDDDGLPVDVIIMLLAYVKSIGKDNSNYIESVAKNWAAEEIFTHEQAEEKLRQLSETAQMWRNVENALGISHRSPSAREEQYVRRWMAEWGFRQDMIREAYDRCVNSTGRMNFNYMNRILERWHQSGISTPQQAAWEQNEKAAARAQETAAQPTYDLEAYETMDFREDWDLPETQPKKA